MSLAYLSADWVGRSARTIINLELVQFDEYLIHANDRRVSAYAEWSLWGLEAKARRWG